MSEFVTVLRARVQAIEQDLVAAQEAGHDYECDLHRARLRELLEIADRNGVDTTSWAAPAAGAPGAGQDDQL